MKNLDINSKKLEVALQKASVLIASHDYKEALRFIEPFLRLYPKNFMILFFLGACYLGMNKYQQTLSYLLKAKKIQPNNPELLINIGSAYSGLGDYAKAVEYFELTLKLKPDLFKGHFNLGNLFFAQAEWLKAIQCYTNAIQFKNDFSDAYINLSLSLINMKKYDDAINVCDIFLNQFQFNSKIAINKCSAIFEKGLKANAVNTLEFYLLEHPNADDLHTLAANMSVKVKDFEKALHHYAESIRINPNDYGNFNNLGILYMEAGSFDLSIEAFKKSIELNPDSAVSYQNIANIFNQQKDFSQSYKYLLSAQKIDPYMPYNKGMIASVMCNMCEWSDFESIVTDVQDSIILTGTVSNPFAPITYIKEQAQLTKIAKDWVESKVPSFNFFPPFDSSETNRRIKIGYYSSDFHAHATAILMAGLFEHHDRAKFEIFAFSFGPDGSDALSNRIRSSFDRFIDVRDLSDRAITAYSREIGIDIAIDLKGFTQDSRTGIFAERAAPIQINFLGFPGSMGAPYIDYIIGDPYVIPKALECHYTERVLRMPHCYQPNDRLRELKFAQQTREMHELPEDSIVLCCFNNNYKITPEIFSVWMKILANFPHTVLWLLKDNPVAEQNLIKEATARGIDPKRLIFANRVSTTEHLARHQCADLFLDTYPCNAHTTASDALWVGLPLVTCSGNSFASRVAGSLLCAVGLESLVTQSIEEYESKIVLLLNNPDQLTQLRQKLEADRLIAPLFDTARYTKDFEKLLISVFNKSPISSN
jgi:predicted O-linked N-acetylglucosamine transferase (SPINDLY family)